MQQVQASSPLEQALSGAQAASIPEITLKSVILGIILSMALGGANAYLGLKVGLTVSACIPAAVLSMAILRLFKESTILENNIVQTAASAGESLAAGTIFTLPALIMIGYWEHFPFALTFCLTALGGLLGVMISVPLRRALLIDKPLRFPEGVATAEVLQAGARTQVPNDHVKSLIFAGCWSALIKFFQTGLQICSEGFHVWVYGGTTVWGFGGGYSLAIIGSGFIVGLPSCISILVGGVVAWVVGIPLYGFFIGLPSGETAAQVASTIWGSHIRMMGVGALVVGGIWTAGALLGPIRNAVSSSIEAFREATHKKKNRIPRTEKDIPFHYVFAGSLVLGLLILMVIFYVFDSHVLQAPSGLVALTAFVISLLVLIIGFLCASIAGYMTGVMGSSYNPLSGLVLMSILVFSSVMLLLLDGSVVFHLNPEQAIQAAGTVVLIACVVACTAAISADNLQDLKSGQLIGATPWKQQVILMVGVIAGALVMAPVTELLFQAYGLGDILPHLDMDPTQALSAPKAAMMAALSQSVFLWSMDWTIFVMGAAVAVGAIGIDLILKKRESRWRLPVLGVAGGIYMPLEVTVPFVVGGILSFLVTRTLRKETFSSADRETNERRGTLWCAGLIAGEALVGVLLAIPFTMYQSTHVFAWTPAFLEPYKDILGVCLVGGLCYAIYRKATQHQAHPKT